MSRLKSSTTPKGQRAPRLRNYYYTPNDSAPGDSLKLYVDGVMFVSEGGESRRIRVVGIEPRGGRRRIALMVHGKAAGKLSLLTLAALEADAQTFEHDSDNAGGWKLASSL